MNVCFAYQIEFFQIFLSSTILIKICQYVKTMLFNNNQFAIFF